MKNETMKMIATEFDDIIGLTVKDVIRVYNGKPGCMCGCKGTYSETSRSKTLAFNKLMKLPLIGVQFNMQPEDSTVPKEVLCIFDPDPKAPRNTVVYFSGRD